MEQPCPNTGASLRTTLLAVAAVLCSGCMTTAGFETGRVLPEGQERTTRGVGVATTTGPRYWSKRPEEKPGPAISPAAPSLPIELEYIKRGTKGLGHGLESEWTIHTPFMAPFLVGAGGGGGIKARLVGKDRRPFALAVGGRSHAHVTLVLGGMHGAAVVYTQLEARLVASIHGLGWAVTLSPKALLEGIAFVPGDPEISSEGGGSVLWGGTIGGGWAGRKADYFVETTLLYGPSAPSWAEAEMSALLPEASRHARFMMGFGWRR